MLGLSPYPRFHELYKFIMIKSKIANILINVKFADILINVELEHMAIKRTILTRLIISESQILLSKSNPFTIFSSIFCIKVSCPKFHPNVKHETYIKWLILHSKSVFILSNFQIRVVYTKTMS